MNVGGMGALAAVKKEKQRLNNQNELSVKNISRKTQGQTAILQEIKNETKTSEKNRITFQSYPCIGWLLGILMMITGLYLIYHISLGKYGSLFQEFREGFWWQYLISSFILIMGIMFLVFLKSENVAFIKRTDSIEVSKKNFFCKEKKKIRKLSSVVSVEVVKRGTKDISNRTIHYKIVLYFSDEKPLEILESSSKFKIKQNYVKVRSFLNFEVEIEKIMIQDETDDHFNTRI